MSESPVLAKRRLQAEVVKPIHEELVAELGQEKADALLARAIRKAAVAEGEAFAGQEPGGATDMASFVRLYDLWMQGGALEVEVLHQDEGRFDFDVTRCRYAEMYRDMDLGHIGHLLSCHRDGTFCEGYDPKIRLERAQTIMRGAPRCTFRYRYDGDDGEA